MSAREAVAPIYKVNEALNSYQLVTAAPSAQELAKTRTFVRWEIHHSDGWREEIARGQA